MKLAAASALSPLQQGELDGLCGLYAVINAMRLAAHPIRPLGSQHVTRLFRAGISWLHAHDALAAAAGSGMSQRRWRALMAHVAAQLPAPHATVRFHPLIAPGSGTTLSTALRRVEAALERHCPVLALINDSYNHFTVISGISAGRITLFDSYGYHWLSRQSCALRRDAGARHRLAPRALIAVQPAAT